MITITPTHTPKIIKAVLHFFLPGSCLYEHKPISAKINPKNPPNAENTIARTPNVCSSGFVDTSVCIEENGRGLYPQGLSFCDSNVLPLVPKPR